MQSPTLTEQLCAGSLMRSGLLKHLIAAGKGSVLTVKAVVTHKAEAVS